jgi:hypothetical protein
MMSEKHGVLVHAPYGRDAIMIRQVLERAGMSATVCSTVEFLCTRVTEDPGAVLISDEALTPANVQLSLR